jgi:hypothetical protein
LNGADRGDDSFYILFHELGRRANDSEEIVDFTSSSAETDFMRQPFYERATDLLSADVGDELVALDADAGHCYGFNGVAATVWRQLEQPRSFDELKQGLLADYEVGEEQCATELQELLDDLIGKGLLRRTSGGDAR